MTKIKRFTPAQRIFHLILMLFFVIQSATGLARMYIETDWGAYVASLFGGYFGALMIHRWVGLLLLIAFSIHLLYVLIKIDWRRFPRSISGPDSLLPSSQDVAQALQHVGWILGLQKPPKFDRWSYLEKFDYWAVFWGVCVLGSTGLVLYSPIFSSNYLPGWMLNVLLWVHRIEALLAMGHVFIIHFFVSHLRRVSFPMDLAMFEGCVDLEKSRHERPSWIKRLEQTGNLEGTLAGDANPSQRLLFYLFGFVVVAIGIFLLIGSVVNAPSLSWFARPT